MTHRGTIMLETERLRLRQFENGDLPALYEIMHKPEVMYAWEHGFTLEETREWLNHQITHFQLGGFGYMAILLKDTNTLIGQAGLHNTEIEGQPITEIGYIFDDTAWGKGYATEASKAVINFAFGEIGLEKLYATIRPENLPSIKVVERLGFKHESEYVKVYNGKEMVHWIFIIERDAR